MWSCAVFSLHESVTFGGPAVLQQRPDETEHELKVKVNYVGPMQGAMYQTFVLWCCGQIHSEVYCFHISAGKRNLEVSAVRRAHCSKNPAGQDHLSVERPHNTLAH